MTALLADRNGDLWIAGGLAQGHPTLSRWTGSDLISYSLGQPQPLEPGWSVLQSRSGAVWLAHPFCQVLGNDLRCPETQQAQALGGGTALAEDAAGNIWLGGDRGVSQWNLTGMLSFTPIGPPTHVGQNYVTAIVAAPDGTMWVGIDQRGPGLGCSNIVRVAGVRFRSGATPLARTRRSNPLCRGPFFAGQAR